MSESPVPLAQLLKQTGLREDLTLASLRIKLQLSENWDTSADFCVS